MKVFKCKKCKKVFFACVDSPDTIIENRKDIKKYQRLGYKLETFKDDRLKDINNWCQCK